MRAPPPAASTPPQATREVEGLVFQMASGLSSLKKLVDALGTPRDTVDHRHRIADANVKLQARAPRGGMRGAGSAAGYGGPLARGS
jgi:hypothetical protein